MSIFKYCTRQLCSMW